MTAHDMPLACAADWLEQALALLTLRLRHEVTLHRLLRGDSGKEGFSGLLLDGEEVEAMLAEMAGLLQASGTAVPMAEVETAEHEHAALRRQPGMIWQRLVTAFGLDEVALDLILLAAAPAIDPRFGRVYGFLNDDLTRRHLTPAVAHRLLARHRLDLADFRAMLHADGVLACNALLLIGPERPLVEAPLRVEDGLVDRLLRAPKDPPPMAQVNSATGVWIGPADSAAAPSNALQDWAAAQGVTLQPVAAQATLAQADPLLALRVAARDAWLDGRLPALCGLDHWPTEVTRRLAHAPPCALVVQTRDPARWLQLGGTGQALSADAAPIAAHHLTRDHAFAGLAAKVETDLTLDDLVLPKRSAAALARFQAAASSFGAVLQEWRFGATFGKPPGLNGLFKGPSGTGKTTAAAALARALDLPLYRANLAGLVSKYIGETEKQLDQLFDAAARHGCALVFEEADALFGKRSEVSDAHDRYANQGTAYLLQRLEAHQGLCLMTTNMMENIDPAFLRRIDAVIDFPAPSQAERHRLWQRITRTQAPLADLDFAWLAEHDLSGGEIRNACLDAAYAAFSRRGAIAMPDLARAIGDILTKKGKPVMKAQFGAYFAALRDG